MALGRRDRAMRVTIVREDRRKSTRNVERAAERRRQDRPWRSIPIEDFVDGAVLECEDDY